MFSAVSAVCLALTLMVSQPGAKKPGVDAAREKWEAVVKAIKADDQASFEKGLAAHRVFVPHVAREAWSSVGGSDLCEDWSGTVLELDEDWAVVRYATEETNIAPPPRGTKVAVKIVGLADLKGEIKPELYEAVRAIHRSPGAAGEFDPVNLIRAVNTLQAVGEEKALAALEAYHRLCGTPCRTWHRLDRERIYWIARLLYVARDPGQTIRGPRLGEPVVEVAKGHEIGAFFPLVVHLDVPFHVNPAYAGSGAAPEDPMEYVRYCKRVGRFRDAPLKPSPDPIAAAQRLLDSGRLEGLGRGAKMVTGMIQRQALNAAGNVIGDPAKWSERGRCTEAEWEAVLQASRNARPRWDAEVGDFVAEKPVR